MRSSFRKLSGDPAAGLEFVWQLTIDSDGPLTLSENLVPELFYDFLVVSRGLLALLTDGPAAPLPAQSLRTIHTRPALLEITAPLVLFGARLAFTFPQDREMGPLPANAFLPRAWLPRDPGTLDDFRTGLLSALDRLAARTDAPILNADLQETENFQAYSDRHKRRIYRSIFGVSRQEMRGIHALHAFLAQACDFSIDSPRIIEYVNADRFYDQPHFNRRFRKLTGLSPLEYFDASSLLQDNLMSASYKAIPAWTDTMQL